MRRTTACNPGSCQSTWSTRIRSCRRYTGATPWNWSGARWPPRCRLGNVLVTGPCGVGKSFLACALAHAACRTDHSVRCYRLPRLADELARYRALNNRSGFLKLIAKVDLLVLDDFGLTPMPDDLKRDLLEILDDRYDRKSTLITSQLPVDQWHAFLADPTLADAILDRLVHNSYRLALTGASMRKQKTGLRTTTTRKA